MAWFLMGDPAYPYVQVGQQAQVGRFMIGRLNHPFNINLILSKLVENT
jgi:hypothetical protein